MATIVLAAAGAAAGGAIGGAIGGSIFGISSAAFGTMAGRAIGAAVGSAIDAGAQPGPRDVQVGRLSTQQIMDSQEGTAIKRVYGTMRAAGTLIWRANYIEHKDTETVGGGGKGGGGSRKQKVETFSYTCSFAVALCEGEVRDIGRVWADGKEIDTSAYVIRPYTGAEDQVADPHIQAVDGIANVPAYRGTAYLVFEHFPLGDFGNRIPQISAEVTRLASESSIRGVCLIPGASEFGYDTTEISQELTNISAVTVDGTEGGGSDIEVSVPLFGVAATRVAENSNQVDGQADLITSLDLLERDLPNVETVLLVIGWFFDDLRCASCTIEPCVEVDDKVTTPDAWTVSGVTRATAKVISTNGGGPAYGSTPNDLSVMRCLAELKARGKRVIVYPFLFGDVAAGNALTNPYDGTTGQAPYPWRGRITLDRAPGVAGTTDKTAAAATEVATFFGTATGSDFGAWNGTTIPYTGGAGGGYRRMILHYAKLVAASDLGAGDIFCIGSEMVGLTTIRSSATTFPACTAFATLAADVAAIIPSLDLTYAADWTEVTAFQPADGSGDVLFPTDEIWSSSEIDFVGIDNYLPLTDINPLTPDGDGNLDRRAWQYDDAYLRSQVEGGEYWDYFYPDMAARQARTRSDIVDSAYAKAWVFRRKDLRAWWANQHVQRIAGVETTATAWAPAAKPIIFTEYGFPAVDLGANQPNVFVDPKSSESALPYFSSGARDDAAQQRAIAALLGYWEDNMPVGAGGTPMAGEDMIDLSRSCCWAWDARPYPAFPQLTDVWSDGVNYLLGHWLNGRTGSISLCELVTMVAEDHGLSIACAAEDVMIQGYLVDAPADFRSDLAPIVSAFPLDFIDDGTQLRAVSRATLDVAARLTRADLGVQDPTRPFERTRAREPDLPAVVHLQFVSADSADYDTGTVSNTRFSGGAGSLTVRVPAAMTESAAVVLVQRIIREAFAQRESLAGLTLPPSLLHLQIGDVIEIADAGAREQWQIVEETGTVEREIQLQRVDLLQLGQSRVPSTARAVSNAFSRPIGTPALGAIPVDVPQYDSAVEAHRGRFAILANPWPGSVDIYRSIDQHEGFQIVGTALEPTIYGTTTTELVAGAPDTWQDATLQVKITGGTLGSATDAQVLAGANTLGVIGASGWEILSFVEADLVSTGLYDLSRLLRGAHGTEGNIVSLLPIGAPVFLLDTTWPVPMTEADVGVEYWWRMAPGGSALDSSPFAAQRYRFIGRGLAPYSPVRVAATRDGSGNIALEWMRRSRTSSSWGRSTAALGETIESYEVDIMSGSTVVRTLTSSEEAATYSAADQTTDFGGVQAALTVRVYQISETFGRGSPRSATV